MDERREALMFLKQAFLSIAGLCAGGIVAAGVFAFLAIIGIFPRLIGITGTKSHVILCETMLILGGITGNLIDLFQFPKMFGGLWMLILWGISTGVFVGCLVMSLAETLKALPVLSRRIHLSVGLQYVILSVAVGKTAGSLVYFANRFGLE